MNSFERLAKLNELWSLIDMFNRVIKILERPNYGDIIDDYNKKHPIRGWLVQKIHYFNWRK